MVSVMCNWKIGEATQGCGTGHARGGRSILKLWAGPPSDTHNRHEDRSMVAASEPESVARKG